MNETLIVAGARTPFAVWKKGTRGDGTPGGRLAECDPYDLAAAAVKGTLQKTGLAPENRAAGLRQRLPHRHLRGLRRRYVVLRPACPSP